METQDLTVRYHREAPLSLLIRLAATSPTECPLTKSIISAVVHFDICKDVIILDFVGCFIWRVSMRQTGSESGVKIIFRGLLQQENIGGVTCVHCTAIVN